MLHPDEARHAQKLREKPEKPLDPLAAELRHLRAHCKGVLLHLARSTEVRHPMEPQQMAFQAGRREVYRWLKGPVTEDEDDG